MWSGLEQRLLVQGMARREWGGVIDPADLSQASTRPSRVTRKGGRLSFYLVFHHATWGLEFFDRANDRIPTHSPFYPRTLRTCT